MIFRVIISMWWGVFLSCALTGCGGGGGSSTPPPPPPPVTISRKPSVFRAWQQIATNLPDNEQTIAKYDMLWDAPDYFGYGWNAPPNNYYKGETIIPITPKYNIDLIRQLNPNLKIIVSLSWHDLDPSWLEFPNPWWKLVNGQRVPSWGPNFLTNADDPTLQDHVATQAKAVMAIGKFDGIMLDWCNPQTPAVNAIVGKVRSAIGPNALLVVNGNYTRLTLPLLAQVNGVFMEFSDRIYPQSLQVLYYNEAHCRKPTHNCFDYMLSHDPANPQDLTIMQNVVKTVTTTSGAHVHCCRTNQNHLHEWFTYYDQTL